MKNRLIILILIVALFSLLFSCIRDEAPNAEADILTLYLPNSIVPGGEITLSKTDTKIPIRVRKGTDLTKLAPTFVLTAGATIYPASGTVIDFTTPQFYTVTSEDMGWSKKYEIYFLTTPIPAQYGFENIELDDQSTISKFHIFYDLDSSKTEKVLDWASANIAFRMTGMGKNPETFPTYQINEGRTGKALKLQTVSTGFFGGILKKPIAAGNLFIGKFITELATSNSKLAIHLGEAFRHEPISLKGYYKYRSGPKYTEGKVEIPGKKDTWDAYAIFFETDEETTYLDGTNQFTNSNIVSVARIKQENIKETDNWTEFNIPFEKISGKEMNLNKLRLDKYSVTVLFTSSINGDDFNGAVGSTLLIDDVEIIHEKHFK